MRVFTLAVFLMSFYYSQAQNEFPGDENGNFVYTEVVQSAGESQKQLYDKAKLWIVSTLKSGDNVVELGGDTSDQITGTGNLLTGTHELDAGCLKEARNVTVNFKFLIFVKESRYKYEVSNFTVRYLGWRYCLSENASVEQIDTDLTELEVRGVNAKNTEKAKGIPEKEIKARLEA